MNYDVLEFYAFVLLEKSVFFKQWGSQKDLTTRSQWVLVTGLLIEGGSHWESCYIVELLVGSHCPS